MTILGIQKVVPTIVWINMLVNRFMLGLTLLITGRPLSAGRLHRVVRVHVLLLVQFDFCT